MEQMKRFYLVIDTSNKKGTKRYAYVQRVSNNVNILHVISGVARANSFYGLDPFFVEIARGKADAENTAKRWNDSHKAQGVYALDYMEGETL